MPQVENFDMDVAFRIQKRIIKPWDNLWDNAKNFWYLRAELIALYNLRDEQLDVIGRRLQHWNPRELWMMSVNNSPKLEALLWSN